MILSTVLVFIYTKLNGDSVTTLYVISVFLGVAFGYSGAWGAYYSELFPSKFRALSAGMSFNGGRIISTFAIPAAAGLGVGSVGMKPIFYVSIIVFILGTVVWCFLPETMKKEQK